MARSTTARAVATAALLAPAAFAQALPDCLVSDVDPGSSVLRRLVDRDGNGYYEAGTNETYDYIRPGVRQDFRQVVPSPWVPGEYFTIDGNYDGTTNAPRILRFGDADNNGLLDPSEIHIAYDVYAAGFTDPETDSIATDGIAIYWISNAGIYEGIWRSVDLNGDGDFEDNVGGVDETTPALVEASGDPVNGSNSFLIGNIPNTIAAGSTAGFDPSEIQRMYYDPNVSPGSGAPGRFFIEDEHIDQVFAVEDRNNDGDFYDPGEIYLFAATNGNNNSSNPVWRDTHPDHGVAFPQLADAIAVADPTTVPTTYYVLEQQRNSATNPAQNVILRGVDLNMDGDINDAGELATYFQATEMDTFHPFYRLHAMAPWNGDLFVTGDALAPDLHSQMIRLIDINGDNRIDNQTEVFPVFDLPADRFLYMPSMFPAGALGPVQPGLPATTRYTSTADCVGSAGTAHKLRIGGVVLGDDSPVMGTQFLVRTYDAAPSANGVIHIGFEFPAPIPLDVGGNCLLTVNPIMNAPIATDGAGIHDLLLTAPLGPVFDGLSLWFETAVLDPGVNPFNVTVSNGAEVRFGLYGFTAPPNPF